MGNLYGSEYWTYLLPRRVGDAGLREVMDSACRCWRKMPPRMGLIDGCLSQRETPNSSHARCVRPELASDTNIPAAAGRQTRAPCRGRGTAAAEGYRDEELRHMRLNFYGFDPSYHVARYKFVYRQAQAWTPLHLARHRQRDERSRLRPAATERRVTGAQWHAPDHSGLPDRARGTRAGRRLPALRLSPGPCPCAAAAGSITTPVPCMCWPKVGTPALERFTAELLSKAPPLARPHLVSSESVPVEGHAHFDIRASHTGANRSIHVPPDYYLCDDCLRNCAIPAPAATATPSSTAPNAVRATPSSAPCPMTGPTPPWRVSPRARHACRIPQSARPPLPCPAPGLSRVRATV